MDLHAIVAQLREELEAVKLSVSQMAQIVDKHFNIMADDIKLLGLNLNNVAASADIELLEALPENYAGIVQPAPATEVTTTEKAG